MAAQSDKPTARRIEGGQPAQASGQFAGQIYDALERILQSRAFQSAPGQSSFLRYVVKQTLEGRGDLKEYCIAIDVFARGESFDQRRDSIVRIEARKMRQNLAKYYEGEGHKDPIRIEVPKGGYVPVFGFAAATMEAEVPASNRKEVETARRSFAGAYWPGLAAILAIAVITTPYLGMGLPTRSAKPGPGLRTGDSRQVQQVDLRPAYEDYSKGRFFLTKQTPDGARKAIDYFQAAIAKEPDYALAYTGLAEGYLLLPLLCGTPVGAVMPEVRTAALRAVKLDPRMGEAHAVLARAADLEFGWVTAEMEFGKALQLNSGDALVHQWYARHLVHLGQLENALNEYRTASRLDPVSAQTAQAMALPLYLLRRYDAAVSQYQRALALDANWGATHQGLGLTYLAMGKYAKGLAESKIAYKLMEGDLITTGQLGYAYALSGNAAMARQVLSDLLHRPKFAASSIAQIYIGLRERDLAYEWLRTAYGGRDSSLRIIADPIYDTLRADARFEDFARLYKPSLD